MKIRKSPTTPAAFRRNAERVLREAHPDDTLTITWTRCNRCTFASGEDGFSGTMRVEAPGYRTREMVALTDRHGTSVR